MSTTSALAGLALPAPRFTILDMKQQPNKKVPNAFHVFQHACRFLSTEQYLSNGPGDNDWRGNIALPTLVLSAFAAELFLKCLLILETEKAPANTHQLHVLFRQISHQRQRRIIELWDVEGRPKILGIALIHNLPLDLPNAIDRCSRAFERIRYGYEADWDDVVYYIDLPRITYKVILEIRSDWRPTITPPSPAPPQPLSQG
ncbi:hypothetical protein [Bradyrhizobium uaiense]|uniref:HEPN domain-containing protein n=1 Tax=Bradyrhizobium uaiense TaxID=2594946 RepID=A0A6P1BQ94_9BRAD|nr:hypothetical protein [Bradyrhizobium uaiense]NEV00698.1 hypothetical protein [Bradyrhizobium uaiense]